MSMKDTSRDQVWLLHVDGSSTTQSSGAGIVITSPQGEDLEFAIKFGFKASNNEAEYETLVIGMRMAHEKKGSMSSRKYTAGVVELTRARGFWPIKPYEQDTSGQL
ncbi:UNVERIFIED_CONTAM: hypothetical protein Slati_1728100 [Sesamum latifolium]|uniref:RNase H type-1 domain-containing protein n=1 Tax=Sesamum latifolium TaxID=2727402 RepID=A0AAW2WW65_9LAMI